MAGPGMSAGGWSSFSTSGSNPPSHVQTPSHPISPAHTHTTIIAVTAPITAGATNRGTSKQVPSGDRYFARCRLST